MPLMLQGKCLKCGRKSFWFGKDEEDVTAKYEASDKNGCESCNLIRTAALSVLLGILASLLIALFSK